MKYKAPAYIPLVCNCLEELLHYPWINRKCITMYFCCYWWSVEWILSLLTLSACIVFCWPSKCHIMVQGCVLTFKREGGKALHFSQCIGYACKFVCTCWNIQVQNAYNVFSDSRLQRALCSLSSLWKLKCSTSNGWGAGMVTGHEMEGSTQ